MMLKKLKKVIEQNDQKGGRLFDLFIQSLIVISIISFSIETLPNLTKELRNFLYIINIICISIFTVEYILRIIVATNKRKYIFSFYGVIDLLAILPFYLTTSIDLRSLRIFRMFRLVRVFKLFRFSKAVLRFKLAFKSIREELILFLFACFFLFFIAGVGIYYFENPIQPEAFTSIFHSLWWAVVTLTTVGYGDIYPITLGGKIFTGMMLMIGLGVIAVPAGLIASAFNNVDSEIESSNKKNNEEISKSNR